MKKLVAAIFSFFVFAVSPTLAYAATLSLSPATGQINKGCQISLDILLDTTGSKTNGTDVILSYDPTVLSVAQSDITNGTLYTDYPGTTVDPTAGKVSISGITTVSDTFSGKGTFATVKFKVSSTASAPSTAVKFDFDSTNTTKSTDSNVVEQGSANDVLSGVTDGNYTIGTGTCTQGIGAVGASSLPISNPVASATALPTSLPTAGLLDNTILVASLGTFLVILGIAGIALL